MTKEIYQELLYIATWNIVNSYSGREKRIIILKPAILKPEPLWTGEFYKIITLFQKKINRKTIDFKYFESSCQ